MPVDTQRIMDQSPDNWLSYGRDYFEQRYSPLEDIGADNIDQLGLAWSFETDFARGLEATPLVLDGVMYVTGTWSVVYALDAATGELIWKHDPQVPKAWGKMACCDAVNRGVAIYGDRIFVATLDARLLALHRATGELLWQVQTADIDKFPYTITGAPRAAKGKVFIGNSGGEYGVRGFVSAYDVETGEMIWRFHTVPGNPADGHEDDIQAWAATTWTGQWWKYGGGGTVWDSIVYDAEFDHLYIGVGNGSPWNRRIRSPQGGDNLFLSSIVALNPDTGEYLWHYQQVPAETWDYTATQHIMLGEMDWQGDRRKVIWQAPKNGFFFIIDRENGSLLSAEPFVDVNWASHYDLETGRPVETPGMDYRDAPTVPKPSNLGAHNWQPMAYHPDTGLVYLPVMETALQFANDESFQYRWGHFNTGVKQGTGVAPSRLLSEAIIPKMIRGQLLAWDPAQQREAWRIERSIPWNGGLLATGGGLLFQGQGSGEIVAMRADTGKQLWQFDAQTGVIGSPMAYRVAGEQYVAIPAGWGGALGLSLSIPNAPQPAKGRILAFKLGGNASLPEVPPLPEVAPPPPRLGVDESVVAQGRSLYTEYCMICHAFNGNKAGTGRVPDLRHIPTVYFDNFEAIVIDGLMAKMGMAGFDDVLDREDALALKAYVLEEANDHWEFSQRPDWWQAVTRWFYELLATVMAWLVQ